MVSVKDCTYNGKAQKPKPTVKFNGKKLKLNHDHALSCKSNTKVGTAKVIVKGDFKGSKTVKLKIAAKPS